MKINAISVKTYQFKQVTSMHPHVPYNKNGRPSRSNSQVPGSSAIILSLGDPKELLFQ
jgi:hypothetical protein